MALYFITYDLRKEHNYHKLYDTLNSYDAVRILESTWCFKRYKTNAKEVRDYFSQVLDIDDGLVVSEVYEWATENTGKTPDDL